MTFQEALLRRGVKFRTSAGGKTHLNCVFCVERGKEADTKFRLCVHSILGWGKCLHCNWTRRTAVFAVLKQLGINEQVSGFEEESFKEQERVELPPDFQVLTKAYDDLDRQALNYILRRGITREQIQECRIGVSYSGRYAYRILFPVFVNNSLRAINARDFTDTKDRKYLNSKGDKFLFHFDKNAHTSILSEGVFKALRIAQVSKVNSASLLGHDLADTQLTQIQESKCERLILYPDPDQVGRQGFVRIADKLTENWKGDVKIVHPVSIPADDDSLEHIKTLLQNPLPYNHNTRPKFLLRG